MKRPSTQSPFAQWRRYLHWRDVDRLLRGHYPSFLACTDSCANPVTSPQLRPKLRLWSLRRLPSAPAANRIFSTLFCESFLGCLSPYPGGFAECICLVLPQRRRPSPHEKWVGFTASVPRTRLFTDPYFGAAAIPLCSGLRVCLPLRVVPTATGCPEGQLRLYIRAERASLPSHASDMVLQATGGARTYTSQDSQHCR